MDQRDDALSMLIARATDSPAVSITRKEALTGGSIHRVEIVELVDGRRFCVKSNRDAGDMFAQEALGLEAIKQLGILKTPTIIAAEPLNEREQCLVMEAIHPTQPGEKFWSNFGADLAEHHRAGTSSQFGWVSDNYLGSTPQKNEGRQKWVDFFGHCRLSYQLRLARHRGLGSGELFRYGDRLISRLDQWLGDDRSPPCLLHGDLWNGNFLVHADGHAVVIDPAVYYGSREAELSMPLLFGGFPQDFFDAYNQTWPLEDGWLERVELYKLYHLLNHLNLFGIGYLESCVEILKRFGS